MRLSHLFYAAISTTVLLSAEGDIAPVDNTMTENTDLSMNGLAVGMSIGTLGIDAEYTQMLSEEYGLAFRIMGGGFSYNGTYDDTDATYDTDVRLLNLGAVLEYHPFKNGFYVGSGLFYNGNKFELNAKPAAGATYTFNGTTYNANLVGDVTGKVENLNKAVPYIGVGYDDSLFDSGNLFFTLKAGAWYQGSPEVSLTSNNCQLGSVPAVPGAPTCSDLQRDLNAEAASINNDIKDYSWWPVLQIGFIYKF